jgi:hypothetical protein
MDVLRVTVELGNTLPLSRMASDREHTVHQKAHDIGRTAWLPPPPGLAARRRVRQNPLDNRRVLLYNNSLLSLVPGRVCRALSCEVPHAFLCPSA